MACRACLHACTGAGLCGQSLEILRRVSAEPEARHLRARSGAGEAAGRRRVQVIKEVSGRQREATMKRHPMRLVLPVVMAVMLAAASMRPVAAQESLPSWN